MLIDLGEVKRLYERYRSVCEKARQRLGRPLTLAEKILFTHMLDFEKQEIIRGKSELLLQPDRVAMQDATAQMAILQFMLAGRDKVAVPTTVHCDHLIRAYKGASEDLKVALEENDEVYQFLKSASQRYGIGFWSPGAGIIHQVVLENYAFPGGLIIGTDSHTPNAGGLGMIAIGVGGADAVDVMVGEPWRLTMPRLIGIHLKGKLNGWTAPKDVILKVAELLTVKGGTGKIIEYFGEGTTSISCTGKATITNMGAEVGATTSIFPFDAEMDLYLKETERSAVAELAGKYQEFLQQDPEVLEEPEKYYDELYEIDLDTLEPHIVGPHTPDLARPISRLSSDVKKNQYPEKISFALIGSCTNSSYEDLTRAADVVLQAKEKGLKLQTKLMVTPGSDRIYETIKRDGLVEIFESAGAIVLANACGPCIGQWKRDDIEKGESNSIVTSFNRNFKRRNDGNSETHAFIGSPEMVVALAYGGSLNFNPLSDTLTNEKGEKVSFQPPEGKKLPEKGFATSVSGYVAPPEDGSNVQIVVKPDSERLALLQPFPRWNIPDDFKNLPILLKAYGKCTTDHVSPAGPWLRYRGHLDNISRNLYMGAVNAFTQETGKGLNILTGEKGIPFSEIARDYYRRGLGWVVVADENYGEGSSREHAAMEPRYLGCRAIIARSFARIAETNLKKQGILPLWLVNPADYDRFLESDRVTIEGLEDLQPEKELTVIIQHGGGSRERIKVRHTLSEKQIEWFYAGSALNYIRERGS